MTEEKKKLGTREGAAEEVRNMAEVMTGCGLSTFNDAVESRYRVLACYAAALVIARDLRKVIESEGDGEMLPHMESLSNEVTLFDETGVVPKAEA